MTTRTRILRNVLFGGALALSPACAGGGNHGAQTINAPAKMFPASGFVLIAGCGAQTLNDSGLNLNGRVLSIYDASDEGAGTCQKLFARSAGLKQSDEVKLNLKLGHGFIYRPLKEWVEPAVAWAKQT